MPKPILILILTLLTAMPAIAQEPLNTVNVDRKSYELWQKGEWKQLIAYGKEARKAGIDFYYLQVRMGIAYFKRGNYHQAIRLFERSCKTNPNNEVVNEYLYFAYVNTGREKDAEVFAQKFSPEMQHAIGSGKKRTVDDLFFNYQFAFADNKDEVDGYNIELSPMAKGSQFLARDRHIFNLYLNHKLGNRVSLFHGYSFTNQAYFVYYKGDTVTKSINDYKANIHQYYLSTTVRLARSWQLAAGVHYLNVRSPIIENNTLGFGGRRSGTATVSKKSEVVAFLTISKDFPFITTAITGSYSGLNQASQLQGNLLLALYPLGNRNLYMVSDLSIQGEWREFWPFAQRYGLKQSIGGKLHSKLWMNASARFGTMENFVEDNALIIHNSIEKTLQQYSLGFNILASKAITINLDYTLTKKRSYFIPKAYVPFNINEIDYLNHSITGGIQWKF